MDVGNENRPTGTAPKNAHRISRNAITNPIYRRYFVMTTPTTTTPTTAAETVAATLAAHPDGITTRDLAAAAGVSASATAKALKDMEAGGTATRVSGVADGNRKAADIWHPGTPADMTAAEAVLADLATDDATPDAAPADAIPASDIPADTTATDDTRADEPTATPVADDTIPDEAAVAEAAPVSGAPVGPRKPDLRAMLMAEVLEAHPTGITADEAIDKSGLSVVMGDTVLVAMEVAGAARCLPTEENAGTELWVLGDGDLASVDPGNAPTHVTCPTCGHESRIRRPSARRAAATSAASTGTRAGRVTSDINSDGSAKLAKGELERRVEAFVRDLGPGHNLTGGVVGRELGRSPGACRNALARLCDRKVMTLASVAPEMFALSDNAPAPSPAVLALMTRPAIAEAAADDAAGADAAADDEASTADAAADDEANTADDTADERPAADATDATDAPAAESADPALINA